MREFYEVLNYELKIKTISRYKISKLMKVNKTTVTNWCKLITEPRAREIKKLCEILDVSADYLLGIETNKTYRD